MIAIDNPPYWIRRLKSGRYEWRGFLNKRARAGIVGFYTYKTKAAAKRAAIRAYAVLWPGGDMI